MARLTDLPEEILLPIFHATREPPLPPHHPRPDNRALLQICLTSRTLLYRAQSILYSSFWCDDPTKTWQIRAFLRTVIARPHLSKHVRALSLIRWRAWNRDSDELDDPRYDEGRSYSTAENRRDRKLFQKAIRSLALSEKQFWRHAVRTDVDEVYVAVLLLMLPNLVNLEISCPSKFEILEKALYHAAVLRPTNSKIIGLQKLKILRFSVRGNISRADVADLVMFFRLPSLESVETGERITSRPTRPWPQVTKNPTLKRLQLTCSIIDRSTLAKLLQSIDSLEYLNYKHCACFSGSLSVFHAREFKADLLVAAAHSLKELCLIDSTSLHAQPLGSLQDFCHLQRLDTETKLLIGTCPHSAAEQLTDILPSSLKDLKIHDLQRHLKTGCGAYDQLTNLVRNKSAKRLQLKVIETGSSSDTEKRALREMDYFLDLVNVSKAAGVTLKGVCLEAEEAA